MVRWLHACALSCNGGTPCTYVYTVCIELVVRPLIANDIHHSHHSCTHVRIYVLAVLLKATSLAWYTLIGIN